MPCYFVCFIIDLLATENPIYIALKTCLLSNYRFLKRIHLICTEKQVRGSALIIEICPVCKSVGFPVGIETVEPLSGKDFKNSDPSKPAACLEQSCTVTYFCGSEYILKTGIKVPLWYKDESDNVPVCYCPDINRNEIKTAVENRCRTIVDVQAYLGKNVKGKCKRENPLGLYCRNIFLNEIEKLITSKAV